MPVQAHVGMFRPFILRTITRRCSLRAGSSPPTSIYQVPQHAPVKSDETFQFWILNRFRGDPNYFNKSLSGGESTFDRLLFEFSQSSKLPRAISQLDKKLMAELERNSNFYNLLGLIKVYFETVPAAVNRLVCFKQAVTLIRKHVQHTPTCHLIQTMFYASLLKNHLVVKQLFSVILTEVKPEAMDKLSVTDLGVFCISLFRSSVPPGPQLLQFLDDRLKGDLHPVLKDPAILICFIKCFRMSKHFDSTLLDLIAHEKRQVLDYHFISRIHLAVYFAGALYADFSFIRPLLTSCVADIDELIDKNLPVRLKDIDNLLWCAATYCDSEVNASVRKSNIPSHLSGLLKSTQIGDVFSLLLWLSIIQCADDKQIIKYVTLNRIKSLKAVNNFKHNAKLFQLLTILEIESPHLVSQDLVKERDKRLTPRFGPYLSHRPHLKRVHDILRLNKRGWKLEDVHFDFAIPALYIGGIIVSLNNVKINVEVIDQSVTLADGVSLRGSMKLKLRLLQKLGSRVIIVNNDITETEELEKMFDREFQR